MIASIDPRDGRLVEEVAEETSDAQLDEICRRAAGAHEELAALGRSGRAAALRLLAAELESRRQQLVRVADRESALGEARLDGELTRTCFQLRFFAEVLEEGSYLEATVDHAGDTEMGRRPDLRRILLPLGPVAVFGASNFPFAFSVPGGDTASALAAGCSVVVKAHDAHPATSLAAAEALRAGAARVGVGDAVQLVFGTTAGAALVGHPSIRAVGFTGSLTGGRHLFELACRRPVPIPFYGELGALNPLVVFPAAAAARATEIAAGLAASFTLGVGQFCTKPGLAFVPRGEAGSSLLEELSSRVAAARPATMLSGPIAAGFASRSDELLAAPGVVELSRGAPAVAHPAVTHPAVTHPAAGQPAAAFGEATPLVLEADPAALTGALLEECFGPVLVVVRYRDGGHLAGLLERLDGALAAALHAEEADADLARPIAALLSAKVGRLVWNGFPTGVAVSWAVHHGGPYPATTDPLHSSVGASAVRRWLRPVAFQDAPPWSLPPALLDAPPAGERLPRRVDGRLTAG